MICYAGDDGNIRELVVYTMCQMGREAEAAQMPPRCFRPWIDSGRNGSCWRL